MRAIALAVSVLFATSAALAAAPDGARSKKGAPKLRAEFPELAGRSFEPGEEVVLRWELSGDGVKYFQEHVWGECELFFSTDGGRIWSRLTPQLAVARRDFVWVVPDLPTKAAKIALQVGIEGEGEFFHLPSGAFTIRDDGRREGLRLTPRADGPLAAGSALELEWSGEVSGLERYEVLVSSDRGAHFFSAGETREPRFTYPIPSDYEGGLTVQIVAHRSGLAPLRTRLDAAARFRVRVEGGGDR